MMDDLKNRVWVTRDKCLGVYMDYKDPLEGSRLMFDAIWKYLNEVLLVEQESLTLSKREINLASHNAFMASRRNLYIGKNEYYDALNENMIEGKPTLITGEAGSGKSALICNWIEKLEKSQKGLLIVYHFVGCSPGSTDERGIIERLTEELTIALGEGKSETEGHLSNLPGASTQIDMRTQINNFRVAMEKFSRTGRKAVLVIDGLDKLDGPSKTEKYLYWLPTSFPEGIYFLTSSVTSNTKAQEELVSRRGYHVLEVVSLDQTTRKELCVKTLLESGKELSPSQLQKVIETPQTQNPFFLKVVLFELCVFGYFRLLDKKIDYLISSESVTDLFLKVIERLEEDYNSKEFSNNVVEQVLCSLVISKNGLSEEELVTIFNIPHHVWSPLYFALEQYILDRSGTIQLAFTELIQAVKLRYKNRKDSGASIVGKLVKYFEKQVKSINIWNLKLENDPKTRDVQELIELYCYKEDSDKLISILTDIYVLVLYTSNARYEYLELFKKTGLNADQFVDKVLKSIDSKIVEIYLENEKYSELDCHPPGYLLYGCMQCAVIFFDLAGFYSGRQKLLHRILRLLTALLDKGTKEDQIESKIDQCKYDLACSYADCNDLEKAIVLHEEVYNNRKRMLEENSDIAEKLAFSSNGLGLCYYHLMKYDQAEKFLLQSLKLSRMMKSDVPVFTANAFMNLALVYLHKDELHKALKYAEDALSIFEEVYFDHLPLEVGNFLTNIGLIHRRLNNIDLAEEMYKRSLEIKRKAVGNEHLSICTTLLNISVILLKKGDITQAGDYCAECLRINEVCCVPEDMDDYMKAKENMVQILIYQQKYEDALPLFLEVFNTRLKRNEIDKCLPFVQEEMTKQLIEVQDFDKAEEVILALLNSKHKSPQHFFLLKCIDDQRPGPIPPRSEDYSLDKALELWPDDENLIKTVIINESIPDDDVDRMDELVSRLEPKYEFMAYKALVEWFDEVGKYKIESKLEIIERGLKKYPDNFELLLLKAKTFNKLGNYREALAPLERICELAPNQSSIIKVTGDCALDLKDYDKVRKYYKMFIENFPNEDENVKNTLKAALQSIDDKEKEEELRKQDTE